MSDERKGLIRAFLTALGGVGISYGVISQEMWSPVAGIVVLAVSLIWGFRNKQSWGYLWSIGRKLLNAVGAGFVTWGVMSPERVEAFIGLVGPLAAILLSWKANGGHPLVNGKTAPVLLGFLGVLSLMALPSCGVTMDLNSDPHDEEFRTPLTGVVIRKKPEGGSKAVVDSGTIMNLVGKLVRLTNGEEPGEVFWEPIDGILYEK